MQYYSLNRTYEAELASSYNVTRKVESSIVAAAGKAIQLVALID